MPSKYTQDLIHGHLRSLAVTGYRPTTDQRPIVIMERLTGPKDDRGVYTTIMTDLYITDMPSFKKFH